MEYSTDLYSITRRNLIERLQRCRAQIETLPQTTESIRRVYNMLLEIISALAIEYKQMPRTQQRIEAYIGQIEALTNNLSSTNQEIDASKVNKLTKILTTIRSTQKNESTPIQKSYNSVQYYIQELARLDAEKKQMEESFTKMKQRKDVAEEELQRQAKAIQDITAKVSQLEKEKQELLKQKDAQDALKERIKNTFSNLQAYIKPIEDEQKRLKYLYGSYIFLGFLSLVALIGAVIFLIYHRHEVKSLSNYIPFYLPIPISAAILWVSIFQLNRAQRQLLVIAHQLHHIKYIEGMLLAINELSSDVSEGASTIKSVINNIIHNYLQTDYNKLETTLQTEISKDKFNLKEMLDFMKESKELFTK